MNILDKIVAAKHLEVAHRKQEIPLSKLTQNPQFKEPCFSLKRSLKRANSSGIIAEHKRKSPSLGYIREHSDVVEVVTAYAKAGAACLSVLTDFEFFGGTMSDLRAARRAGHPRGGPAVPESARSRRGADRGRERPRPPAR